MDHLITKANLFWQYPVITEKIFYEQHKDNDGYVGFPWATVIDKNINLTIISNLIRPYLTTGETYTCCQHIHFRRLIPLFQSLRIKRLYIPHKILGEDHIRGIQLLPCPLYAVNIEDPTKNQLFQQVDLLHTPRSILYSFKGGYQNNYLTRIRQEIFRMKHPSNCMIEHTGSWHFNEIVYSNQQNHRQKFKYSKNHIDNTNSYNELLLHSRYSLCPSGSGPNSIRFWESLGSGSIPILLADTLELPSGIDWSHTIIRFPESKLHLLPQVLSRIPIKQEQDMRKKCLEAYSILKNNYSHQ